MILTILRMKGGPGIQSKEEISGIPRGILRSRFKDRVTPFKGIAMSEYLSILFGVQVLVVFEILEGLLLWIFITCFRYSKVIHTVMAIVGMIMLPAVGIIVIDQLIVLPWLEVTGWHICKE